MKQQICQLLIVFGAVLVTANFDSPSSACCPVPPAGKPVVNADQTVVILWDPITKTEHFIRRASFKSDAGDFGFLVPTPAQPDLSESGDAAFPYLAKLTEPEIKKVQKPRGGANCLGCAESTTKFTKVSTKSADVVTVLQEKSVAGFQATVLAADSTKALLEWLKTNGYAFSPEVEAWAKPYVEGGWKFTALKMEKGKSAPENKSLAAAALRISFKTDHPLFPYREPDPRQMASKLGASHRLLRIYFVADKRYGGGLTQDVG